MKQINLEGMEQITVIIPFRNEGKEVFRTIEELRLHCDKNFRVVVINDASEDKFDYSELGGMSNVEYIQNTKSKGVAACRDMGASLAQTPYLLFLDAHMFVTSDILSPLHEFLKENPHALACLQTVVYEGMAPVRRPGRAITRGCRINFSPKKLWMTEWQILTPEDDDKNILEIPCVMGAAYGISREYYNYLHGLKGLSGYGGDEQLLSTKVWREGGRCVLLKDVEIGHWYRSSSPYEIVVDTLFRNRLVTTKLLAPELLPSLAAEMPDVVGRIMSQLPEKEILEEYFYLQGIFKRDMEFVYNLNGVGNNGI